MSPSYCATLRRCWWRRPRLAAHGEPQHPQDLSRHDCLYYPRGTEPPRWRFSDPAQPQREIVVEVRGPFATNNSESIRDAALDGLGIAMLPDFSARQALAEGRLRQLLPQWRIMGAFASHIWIVRPGLLACRARSRSLASGCASAFRRRRASVVQRVGKPARESELLLKFYDPPAD